VRHALARLPVGGGGEARHHARGAKRGAARIALAPALGFDIEQASELALSPAALGGAAGVLIAAAAGGGMRRIEREILHQAEIRDALRRSWFDQQPAEHH
jgi:hypothetical protein